MNPYEANTRNIVLRLAVWLRGMMWLYRRPLIVMAIASMTMAVGVGANQDVEIASALQADRVAGN
jgi:hypothetical protein